MTIWYCIIAVIVCVAIISAVIRKDKCLTIGNLCNSMIIGGVWPIALLGLTIYLLMEAWEYIGSIKIYKK